MASGQVGAVGQGKLPGQLEPLSRILEGVLGQAEGLKYVRHDGYCLLKEVLVNELVSALVEALAPGTRAALDAEMEIPEKVMVNIREIVRVVQLRSGGPQFELWHEEGQDAWIRSTSNEAAIACAGQDASRTSNKVSSGKIYSHTPNPQAAAPLAAPPVGSAPEAACRNLHSGPSPQLQRCIDETATQQRSSIWQAPVGSAALPPPKNEEEGSPQPQTSARPSRGLPGWVSRQRRPASPAPSTTAAASEAAPSSSGGLAPHPERGFEGRSAGDFRRKPLGDDPINALHGPWGGCKMWTSKATTGGAALSQIEETGSRPLGASPQPASPTPSMQSRSTEMWLEGSPQPGAPRAAAAAPQVIAPRVAATPAPAPQAVAPRTAAPPAQGGSHRHPEVGKPATAPSQGREAVPPQQGDGQRHRGRLKAFYPAKGFGFLVCDTVPDCDIFAHSSNFTGGACEPARDAEVEFDLDTSRQKPRALNIFVREGPKDAQRRLRGRLKTYKKDGFGFIACPPPIGDVFVHVTAFEAGPQPEAFAGTPGTQPLGPEVEFTLDARNPAKPRALNAQLVGLPLLSPATLECGAPAPARTNRGGSPDKAAGTGGEANGAAGPLDVLADAFREVLQKTDALTYVRHDGFCLLNEVLCQAPCRNLLEEIEPQVPKTLSAEDEIPEVLRGIVQEVVQASAKSGRRRLELWDDWVRLADEEAAKVEEARPSAPNHGAASIPDTTGTSPGAENGASDDHAWWMGDVKAKADKAHERPGKAGRTAPPHQGSRAAPLRPVGATAQSRPDHLQQQGPAAAAQLQKETDPWVGCDPWSGAARGREPRQEAKSGAAIVAPAPAAKLSFAGTDTQAHAMLQESSTQEILAMVAGLPGDAPRGVREYLRGWAEARAQQTCPMGD